MAVAMLLLHLESTLAKEGHTRKFKLRFSRFYTRWHCVECEEEDCLRLLYDDGGSLLSPFHTARRTRNIPGTLPGRLLCKSNHVPELITEFFPGRGPSNIAGYVSESPRKRKRELRRQRERNGQINKTKVNIGVAFPRWKELMRSNDFKKNADVACFLLDRDCLEVETDLQAVLSKAFLQVDAALAAELQIYGNASLMMVGTTATVALLRDGIELVVGSVGDSRALLCRKGKVRKLTDDHTPERKDEKQRVRQSGGFVAWNSVGQANVNGRLAMTRSIGDFDLKKIGVIAEPETTRTLLQHAHDSFLVLTTDGINFIMTNQEICDVINQCHDPTEAANVIAEQALQYGSEDNSTLIVVPFGAWGKHQNAEYTYDMSRNFASIGRWS
ncbi:protein phosphatase Mn(2+)-dependent 1K isoform X1 [Pseudorasbora parva]|uniref:protein phosphatase Mn(2+)-dependent 1K isoform X1 n=1 Tax=Pseudorasbora parva TaxID=51549 RepID=UPI00351F055E